MIFIVFFGLIVAVVVGLNIVDSSNISKIEKYLKSQKCNPLIYINGLYQGACEDKIILIKNGFSVDISKPEKVILYKDIKYLKKDDKKLKIETLKDEIVLDFKEKKNLEEFYNKVNNKK